ncbi:uncharacterized protein LOC142568522 [Dermacentor variabilis]|uniref:uncharacterized protein LOC142568522 n=1 Tax=Dermacentor variabilis TaxID=34621 RepID=UPI003F5C2ACB
MPDQELRRVHCFRDHAVAGANWRQTRFVDEVPSARVCGLCRMIPMRTVTLPCSHALCPSCYAASSRDGVGLCPLDQQPFEEAESLSVVFPAKKVESLKVYCWNAAQGCEFVGTVEGLLPHYENACTFHSVECFRCNEAVLHKDLPGHYANGCSAVSSSATTDHSSLESTTARIRGMAMENLKLELRDPHRDLSAIRSQMNDLSERAICQEARSIELAREFRASVQNLKDEMTKIAAAISMTGSHQLRSERDPLDEAGTSSPLPLRLEKALILRKLEHFAHMSLDTLEHLRQNATRHGHRPVIAYCEPVVHSLDKFRLLTSAVSTAHGLGEELSRICYSLILQNADGIFVCEQEERKFADVTVSHTRDTYLTLVVWKRTCGGLSDLVVDIEFNGLLVGSRCVLNDWSVKVRHSGEELVFNGPFECGCICTRDLETMIHFHRHFTIPLDSVKNACFLKDGNVMLEIQLDYLPNKEGIDSSK